jgi:hypothetical protein
MVELPMRSAAHFSLACVGQTDFKVLPARRRVGTMHVGKSGRAEFSPHPLKTGKGTLGGMANDRPSIDRRQPDPARTERPVLTQLWLVVRVVRHWRTGIARRPEPNARDANEAKAADPIIGSDDNGTRQPLPTYLPMMHPIITGKSLLKLSQLDGANERTRQCIGLF